MIGLALLLAGAQPAETPRQFIIRVYAGYRHSDFSPLAQPRHYFTPELSDAIRKDSVGRELGYLDGDPLCGCQDFARLRARILSLKQPSQHSADARVRVDLGIGEARTLHLALRLTRKGWRIADIVSPNEGSLMNALQRSKGGR